MAAGATRARIVAIGCNIHEQMSAYIVVVDTPHLAKASEGKAVLRDLAAGQYALRVWYPGMRSEPAPQNVTLTAAEAKPRRSRFSAADPLALSRKATYKSLPARFAPEGGSMELDVAAAGPARQVAPFVALSRFRVANGMAPEVQTAFRQRPHLVDEAAGFLRMEVISPHDDPSEFWLLTWWADAESYATWHKSHLYRESHEGIPRGLKLDPTVTQVRFFSAVSD